MSLRYCPKEPEVDVWDNPYCRNCGAKTEPLPTCCDQRFFKWDKFCGQCGKPVKWPQQEETNA